MTTRMLYLQDDTSFPPQAWWTRTDGTDTVLSDPAATAALEQRFSLELAPLRRIADLDDGHAFRLLRPWLMTMPPAGLEAIPPEQLTEARALLAESRAHNDAAWTSPAAMRAALVELLGVLGPEDAPMDSLVEALAAAPLEVPVELEDLAAGRFHDEVRDLLRMVAWAEIRGAQRVRLWLE